LFTIHIGDAISPANQAMSAHSFHAFVSQTLVFIASFICQNPFLASSAKISIPHFSPQKFVSFHIRPAQKSAVCHTASPPISISSSNHSHNHRAHLHASSPAYLVHSTIHLLILSLTSHAKLIPSDIKFRTAFQAFDHVDIKVKINY